MNKSELVEVAAKEAGITKAAADKALTAIIGAVVKTVTKGESVTLVGFGTFKSAKRAARTGKNPKTGATLKIPATTVPKFTAGSPWYVSDLSDHDHSVVAMPCTNSATFGLASGSTCLSAARVRGT